MATKLAVTKPVVKKSANVVPEKIVVAKSQPASKVIKVPRSKKPVVNAETARVLRDADAGKNLSYYADADDLFRKLGIKGRKA